MCVHACVRACVRACVCACSVLQVFIPTIANGRFCCDFFWFFFLIDFITAMAEAALTRGRKRRRKQLHPLQSPMLFDSDIVDCWRSIGESEDLTTDTGIAKFLISL